MKLTKAAISILITLMFFYPVYVQAYAEPDEISGDEYMRSQLAGLDLDSWEAKLNDGLNMREATGRSFAETVEELASGRAVLGVSGFFDYIIKVFGITGGQSAGELIKLVVIAVLCSVLNHMKSSFNSGGVSDMTYYACYLVVLAALMSSLYNAADIARNGIDSAAGITRTAFPALLTLTTATGGLTSGAMFTPIMGALTGGMIEVVKNAILPLVLFSGAIGVVSGITKRMNIGKLAKLSNDFCKWVMGISFTVFLGVMAIQGLMSSTYDGISMRMAKYAVDKFIPVVGGMLSDTVDTIVGYSMIVKNALGAGTLMLLAVSIIAPLIKILLGMFQFKLISALLEPIADKRIVDAINGVSGAFVMFFAVLAMVSAMLFIALTLFLNLRGYNV